MTVGRAQVVWRALLVWVVYAGLGLLASAAEALYRLLDGRALEKGWVYGALVLGVVRIGCPMALVALVGIWHQWLGKPTEIDYGYFPRPGAFLRILKSRLAMAIVCAGLLLLFVYWYYTGRQIAFALAHTYGTPVLPPRALCTILLAWGFLWMAEALTRPRRTTLAAATAYTSVCLWVTWSLHGPIVLE
jgi:hypothetical protein